MQSLTSPLPRRKSRLIPALTVVVTALAQFASAATLPPITLAWNENPESDIAGYELKYGTSSGSHGTTINAGLNTSTQVSGLSDNVRYYFVVVAYNTAGQRSAPSSEISYFVAPNQAPNATISAPSSNVTITAGQSVSFSGSGSDPDGNTPLTYSWNFGSGSGISNSSSQNPGSRQFNNPGTYQVTLTVTDSQGLADPTPAQRTITVNPPVVANQAPNSTISAPSSNVTITAGQTVSFTGSGSDPDGNTPLSYLWNFGSGSGISSSTSQNPGSRQFNNPGTYQVTLTVTDAQGLADPTPAQRTITVNPPVVANQAPDSVISNPFTNATISAGETVYFTGSGTDPDGNTPLSYSWNFGSGSGISNSTSQNPGSRQFNNPGTYVVTLTVSDSQGLADPTPAQRTITVNAANQAPDSTISTPSSSVTITAGESVNFAGSGSDPDDNTPLTYSWNFGSGSGIANSTSQNPGSVQFNNPGVYQVTLTVTDSQGLADSTPAQRTITVNAPVVANQAPESSISYPSSDVTIEPGGTVYFSGSGSDPDGNTPLTYLWDFGNGSGISDSTSYRPRWLRFDNPGTFVVTFTVTDSKGLADPTPAQRTITVNAPVAANQAPDSTISSPSSSVTITAGQTVSFAGSGNDPDGNTPLAYSWNFGSGSGIANSTSQNPGSRQFNNPGTYVVTLTVTDSQSLADPTPAQRTITVNPPVVANQAPDSTISSPSSNVTITAGQTVSFTGSGNDPDGNTPLTYSWNFGSGSGISNSSSQNPGLRLFNNPGTYVVTLTVTDSQGLADPTPAQRTITVNPPVVANQAPDSTISAPSSNVTITAGETVSFSGNGSDPDGNTPLAYSWNFGSGSGISNSTAQNPGSRQFNNPGTYVVTLTVTDSLGLADPTPAQRTITVNEAPPAPPTAGLDGWIDTPSSDVVIPPGGTVNFSGGGTDASGGRNLTYYWNFGRESGIGSTTSQNPGLRRFREQGTFEVTLTVIDRSTGKSDPTPAKRTIIVTNNPNPPSIQPTFATWITGHNVGGQTGPNDDFDSDGLPNAVENLLGTNPAAHSPGLAVVSKAANSMTFRHTRSTTPAGDLKPVYEWSSDLIHWHPDGGSHGGVTVSFGAPSVVAGGTPETIQVSATANGGTTPNLFVRLKAATP